MDGQSLEFDTPLGRARAVVDAQGALQKLCLLKDSAGVDGSPPAVGTGPALSAAGTQPGEGSLTVTPTPANAALQLVEQQLAEYFAGTRRRFDVPLNPRGTEFQRRVWDELLCIPYGETTTYGRIAQRLGLAAPDSARSVGSANGANPIWIIVPCHRVIGADGSLTGYAGGLHVKRALLELEGALSPGLFDS